MQLPEVRQGMAAVEFKGWVGFDQNIWQDIIGGVETSGVIGGAVRMRLGRSTALEANVENSYWSGIGLGEIRWGVGLVLTR